jgi:hypothetical protein
MVHVEGVGAPAAEVLVVVVVVADVLVVVLAPPLRFAGAVAAEVVLVVVLVVDEVEEALTARLMRFAAPAVTVTVVVDAGGTGSVTVHGGAVTVTVVLTGVPVLVTTVVESVMGTKDEQNDDAFSAIRTTLQSLTRSRRSSSAAGAT